MGKIKENIIIAELIAKEISNNLTKAELVRLNKWRSNSKNLNLYNEILAQKDFELRNNIQNSTNLDYEWKRFYQYTDRNNNIKFKRRIITSKFMKYAAVIIPILFVSIFFVVKNNFAPKEQKIAISSIAPGENRAVLVLSNGKSIKLSSKNKFDIKESNGVNLSNSSRELTYVKSKKLSSKETIYNTININKGGEYQLILSDGTKVWMNSMSSLKYPINFDQDKRVVELKGEAYFEVSKDTTKPFIVKTNYYDVKVLGTSFNISSYSDNDVAYTTLVTGKVEISGIKSKGNIKLKNNKLILVPGEQAVYSEGKQPELSKRKVDVSKYTAWKDGRFIFEDERLEDIMKQVERWYDVNVFYMNDDLKDIEFRGNINRYKDFNTLLKKIEMLNVVEFKIKGNTVTVIKK